MGSHTGTHVDAPYHFLEDGAALDRVPLHRFVGPARVVAIDAPMIGARELRRAPIAGARKILLKTRNRGLLRRRKFHPGYVALRPDGAAYLLERGVDLVGIDYLSIEPYDSPGFPTHRLLLGHGALIVEGLDLARVRPGDYELLCFPLRLHRGDGAPARVALRTTRGS